MGRVKTSAMVFMNLRTRVTREEEGMKRKGSRKRAAVLFILPSAVVLTAFIVAPIIYGFYISLLNYNLAMPASSRKFVGLKNYVTVFSSGDFRQAMLWTAIFVVISVTGTVILAMALALFLNSPKLKGFTGRFVKTVFILPMMLCPLVVSNIWYIIFAPNYGLINSTLNRLGASTISFFGNTFWARLAILTVEFWWATPYIMIILLAALTTVPNELTEAAQIEGAGKARIFFRITLPCISNFVVLVISIRLMDALRMFDISFALTEGGPQKSTETIAFYIYETGFKYLKVGEASAASFILFLLIALVTFLFIRFTRKMTSAE